MLYSMNKFAARMAGSSQQWSWALLRILSSAMFMTHGFSKLFGDTPQAFRGAGMTTVKLADFVVFPMPMEINALFVAGVIEFFGGFLILIGLWTHLAAFLAMLLMLMAYLTAHPAWFPTLNNGELAALYFLTYLIIFTLGPGVISVDTWRDIRRQKKHEDRMEAMARKVS